MFYLNEKLGNSYSHYAQAETITINLHLEYFEGVFMNGVDSIVTKLDNYNEIGQWFYLLKI